MDSKRPHSVSKNLLEDRSLQSALEDKLDRGSFVDGLVRALVRDFRNDNGGLVARSSTNFVIGLTGPWGSGKSSILALLALKLGSMDRVVVASLNPWLFKGRDELVVAFFSSLRQAMGQSTRESIRDTVSALERYQEAVGVPAQVAAALIDLKGT